MSNTVRCNERAKYELSRTPLYSAFEMPSNRYTAWLSYSHKKGSLKNPETIRWIKSLQWSRMYRQRKTLPRGRSNTGEDATSLIPCVKAQNLHIPSVITAQRSPTSTQSFLSHADKGRPSTRTLNITCWRQEASAVFLLIKPKFRPFD